MQCFVDFEVHNFVDLEVQISWQVQYFVDLEVQICGRCSTLWTFKAEFR